MIGTTLDDALYCAACIAHDSRDPYKLCTELDIEIIANHALEKDGYLICDKNCKLIFISSNIFNVHRKRFIVAHELGHYFLHQEALYGCASIKEIQSLSSSRINNSVQEDEANQFASNFLLPENLLSKRLPNSSLTFGDISVIAHMFDTSVTLTAMKAVQLSKTENEILLCYDHNRLKWFTSSRFSHVSRWAIPTVSPTNLQLTPACSEQSNAWDTLYNGCVHQEIFHPYGNQYLVLLSGTRA